MNFGNYSASVSFLQKWISELVQ